MCASSASTGLCGGQRLTAVPTATEFIRGIRPPMYCGYRPGREPGMCRPQGRRYVVGPIPGHDTGWGTALGTHNFACAPSGAVPDSFPVLLVADVSHPIDHFAVLPFLNGDVRHRGGRRGAMPVLLPGGNQTTSPGRTCSSGPLTRD